MRKELLNNWLENLPEGISIDIGFEHDDEKLHIYKADYRKEKDRMFKDEIGGLKVWLISEVNGELIVVDGSNEVILEK